MKDMNFYTDNILTKNSFVYSVSFFKVKYRQERIKRNAQEIHNLYMQEHDEIEHFSQYIPAHIRLKQSQS